MGKNVKKFKLLLLSVATFVTTLSAAPIAMHLDTRALSPQQMVMTSTNSLSAAELGPLIFPPKLYNGGNAFSVPQAASTSGDGSGIFNITAPANTLLNVQIIPAASGIILNGNPNTSAPYPIVSTTFASPVDSSGNFTMGSTGQFTLAIGGTLFGPSGMQPAGMQPRSYTYQSNSIMLKVTNRTTLASIQAPFQINFNYLAAGTIQSVRSLVFPAIILNPSTGASQNINPGDTGSAQLNYSPITANVTLQTPSTCLTLNGTPPPTPCTCSNNAVQVTFTTNSQTTSCSTATQACKFFVGGTACYPAGLAAGIYQGTGQVTMTYS